MRKSVIFWNVISIIFILWSYLHTFNNFGDKFGLLLSESAIGSITFLVGTNGIPVKSLFNYEEMHNKGFTMWFSFITPFILIALVCYYSYKAFLKFNTWLDSK